MDTSHFINGGAKTLCLTVELSTRKYLPPCTEFPFLLIIGAHVGVLKGKTLADRKKTSTQKASFFCLVQDKHFCVTSPLVHAEQLAPLISAPTMY